MASSFGKTWWGKLWLQALSKIDYSNRLPRGARYARNGMVRELSMAGGLIKAMVSGSRPRPYSVKIGIPQFSAGEKKAFMKELARNPIMVSKLLNRELDPKVMNIAGRAGMKVFPSQWTDFEMDCSCPDWAVPCKHLAATIYMVGMEIDNNPFLVFEMHGLDILGELERMGLGKNLGSSMEIPLLSSLFRQISPTTDSRTNATEYDSRIDYSLIPQLDSTLPAMLEDSPVFYASGNFKKTYSTCMRCISSAMQRILANEANISQLLGLYGSPRKIEVHERTSFPIDFSSVGTHRELLASLAAIPLSRLNDYPQGTIALYRCLTAAMQLIAHGAIVPEIVNTGQKGYAIRWMPAQMDRQVEQAVNTLDAMLPGGVLTVKEGGTPRTANYANQARHILSAMISTLMPHLLAKSYQRDSIIGMFFTGTVLKFSDAGEGNIPGGIKAWLDRFSINKKGMVPVIVFKTSNDTLFEMNIGLRQENGQPPISIGQVMEQQEYADKRMAILQSLSQLSRLVPGIDDYLNSGGANTTFYDLREMGQFLLATMPAMQLLGIEVVLPRGLRTIFRPHLSMRIGTKPSTAKGSIRLDDLLQFDWRVAVGDRLLPVDDFEELARQASGLLHFKGQYIYLSPENILKIRKSIESTQRITPGTLLQTVLSGEYHAAPVEMTDELKQLVATLTSQTDQAVPQEIKATLRPYQQRGFSWMYKNLQIGFGSIIADDMGLGKTLQVITLIQQLKNDGDLQSGKVMVVAPTGLLLNWQHEVNRFAPALSVFVYHGSSRNLEAFDADILITSYGTLRSDTDLLKKRKWQLLVIDEAQNIKNTDTAQAKAVKSIKAATHIAMSGTPVENRLAEFWSIMDFANKGYLGTIKSFKEQFANPIQMQGDRKTAERFRRVTAPFMMRRLKTDKTIISDLPDKIEENEWTTLTSEQAAIYQQTLELAMAEIESSDGDTPSALFKRQGLILQMMLALKQICNHPALYLKNKDSRPELSGKAQTLLDMVESISENGEKVLIFTQFKEMGELLKGYIRERLDSEPLFLHGGCTIKERQEMTHRFQNNAADRVFILSLKAAGTGLNLTAATHVIHYDLWWNPAVEAQATDRAYRIGQHRNVIVHRFITKHTLEERIDQMIKDKKHLADMTVATGESWIGKLSNKELREITRLSE